MSGDVNRQEADMANAKRKKPRKRKPRAYTTKNSPVVPRTITTMRLPNDLLALLKEEAERRQRSRSSLIEEVLYDFVRRAKILPSVFG